MGARLLYRDSRGRDGQVDLSPDTPCYVGRALDCAIRTDDAMVSRKHSMIRMENGGYFVEDLGSSNGTHVNNQRVSKLRLNHNDVVRCGSLLLRYVEDGPLVAPGMAAQPGPAQPAPGYGSIPGTGYGGGSYGGSAQPQAPAQPQYGGPPSIPAATPKRGGTQRLDAGGGAGGVSQAAGYGGSAAAGPYGSPPSIPGNLGGFGPPDIPSDTNPFGGPPPMPGIDGVVASLSGDNGTTPGANPFATQGAEDSVVVDLDSETAERLTRELEETRQRLDDLQTSYDREVADGKRLRAETATLRERIEQLGETIGDRDDQVKAHARVAEELREELTQTRNEQAQARSDLGELAEEMQAKERQLGRAHEDIAKLKDEMDDFKRQLAEVSRTKDEGWKKLNEQLGEIEHLREVINEQERMLEERRVGLISQEEVIKELRAERERQLKRHAQLKAELEELRAGEGRRQAQLQAIDEENKRLSRLLAESQSGGGASGTQTVDLTNELREIRIEARKLEADRDRYREMLERADGDVQKQEERIAQLEVALREANDRKAAAASSQSVVEESLAKAEVARHKAAEEMLAATKARDEAVAAAEKFRREADRLRRRMDELENAPRAEQENSGELAAEKQALERKLKLAEDRAGELERSLGSLRAELDAARADAKAAQTAAANGAAASAPAAGDAGGALVSQIQTMAMEVYESINDILSEIRNNLRLVQGDFAGLAEERTDEPVRIISDTIQTLIDSAEDAKGVVRGLRELAEFH